MGLRYFSNETSNFGHLGRIGGGGVGVGMMADSQFEVHLSFLDVLNPSSVRKYSYPPLLFEFSPILYVGKMGDPNFTGNPPSHCFVIFNCVFGTYDPIL